MIRRLYPWEIADVAPIAQAFQVQANLLSPFNVEVFIANMVQASLAGVLYLGGAFKNGRLVGALCGTIAPNIMCGDLIAQELFWYVLPEHRGGTDGVKLKRDFEDWAGGRADHIVMASFYDTPTSEAVAELYKRSGYSAVETHYLKTL